MSAAKGSLKKRDFRALDGWRGVCALMVALLHLEVGSHIFGLSPVQTAYLLVDCFFVLSGFVLTHAYRHRIHDARSAGVMMWRRFARLWPLHVVMLAAFVLLELGASIASAVSGVPRRVALFDPASTSLLEAVPSHLLLLHSMGLHDRLTWNIPSWSISVEYWTGAVFALIVIWRRRTTLLAVAAGLAGLGVLALADRQLYAADHDLGFFRCLLGFFVGHLTYKLSASRALATARLPWTGLEVAAITAIPVLAHWTQGTRWVLAMPIALGGLVWLLSLEGGRLSDLLKSRPAQALGRWSYAIYMIHALVVALIGRVIGFLGKAYGVDVELPFPGSVHTDKVWSLGSPWIMDLVTIGYLVIVIAFAAAAWRYIEMPCQAFLNRLVPDNGRASRGTRTASLDVPSVPMVPSAR